MAIKIGYKKDKLLITDIEVSMSANNRVRTLIECRCDCGKVIVLDLYKFLSKKSCGCSKGNKRYEMLDKKVYSSWRAMKTRCFCKNGKPYKNYGGRGITICEHFLKYNNFRNHIGLPPTKTHSVDRIDVNGNYSCGGCEQCIRNGWGNNVRWATPKQQGRNRRVCYKVKIDDKTVTLKEACEINGLPYKQIHERVKRGKWDIEIAVTTPISVPHIYKKIKQNDKT